MLAALGLASLDALSTRPCPRRSACAGRCALPAAARRARAARRAARAGRAEPGVPLVHRHGLPRLHHAAGDPAQRPREPGLVHAVHALPGGDRAGPAGGAAQLPDDGRRPHRPAARQRVAARRGHRRRRGDGACAAAIGRASSARRFFVAEDCHPQTIAVVQTRARAARHRGRVVGAAEPIDAQAQDLFGVLVQYPTTDGASSTTRALAERAHAAGALVVVAADLLALTLLRAAGRVRRRHRRRLHASASACRWASAGRTPRSSPRATSTSARCRAASSASPRTRDGQPALPPGAADPRAAHPPREGHQQHLHGAGAAGRHGQHVRGLPRARRAARDRASASTRLAARLAAGLRAARPRRGRRAPFFDTLRVAPGRTGEAARVLARGARSARINLRDYGDGSLGIALDETATADGRARRCSEAFAGGAPPASASTSSRRGATPDFPAPFARTSALPDPRGLQPPPLRDEMLRYIHRLEARDLSLTTSMIPLGSCTMKLNATAEMMPVTWPEFGELHPFAPAEQTQGYAQLFARARGLAGRDHRLRRRLAAAERRLAGRVRGPAGHPRLPREPRRGRTATSA